MSCNKEPETKDICLKRQSGGGDEEYLEPMENDVILGRGRGAASFPGNVQFRRLVWQYRSLYQMAQYKKAVGEKVMQHLTRFNPPARFLIHDSIEGRFTLAPPEKAFAKVLQTLKDSKVKLSPPKLEKFEAWTISGVQLETAKTPQWDTTGYSPLPATISPCNVPIARGRLAEMLDLNDRAHSLTNPGRAALLQSSVYQARRWIQQLQSTSCSGILHGLKTRTISPIREIAFPVRHPIRFALTPFRNGVYQPQAYSFAGNLREAEIAVVSLREAASYAAAAGNVREVASYSTAAGGLHEVASYATADGSLRAVASVAFAAGSLRAVATASAATGLCKAATGAGELGEAAASAFDCNFAEVPGHPDSLTKQNLGSTSDPVTVHPSWMKTKEGENPVEAGRPVLCTAQVEQQPPLSQSRTGTPTHDNVGVDPLHVPLGEGESDFEFLNLLV